MKKYFLTALVICALISCSKNNDDQDAGHETESPLNAQTKEMLAIHDSIMPRMDQLMELKTLLKKDVKATDSLLLVKPAEDLKAHKEEALRITMVLDSADRAMMDWMHSNLIR